jgi:hypothetical protein
MRSLDDFDADPELGQAGDENDPEYQAEMFETFRAMRWKPEDLKDLDYAQKYAEWLKTAPPDEE